jgi:predicted phosphodiesterase
MTQPIVLTGPALVFGGPYSNLEATQAVLGEAARRAIPPSHVICTSDVVAYCADAVETVALIRRSGIHVLLGNCEESLGAGAADCGCGFAEGTACDLLSVAWFAHASRTLGPEERQWMAALPRTLIVEIAGLRLAVVHGSFAQINRFVFASTPDQVKIGDLDHAQVDGILAGHCGLPFTQTFGGRLWHNSGAIGIPANDGTPRIWCSLLTPGRDPRTLTIEHLALDYSYAQTAAKMRGAGLPEGYAQALATGLWPSCDVLPPAELAERGKALAPGALVWRRDAAEAEDMRTHWPVQAHLAQAAGRVV